MNKRLWIIIGVFGVIMVAWMGLSKRNNQSSEQSSRVEIKVTAKELYTQAKELKEDRELAAAKKTYRRIIAEYSDYENIEMIQKELEELNMEILFSNSPTENSVAHEVKSGDTLGKLAKKYGTTIDLIKVKNRLKNDIIRVGQQLRIWTGTFAILVDKSQNILMLKQEGEILKVYDVSTGEDNNTPVGEFEITSRLVDPVWFNQGVMVPPESPQNVLGSRWLGFNIPQYGIHGTIDPGSIGSQVTAGCVRMRNEDVEELFNIIPLGTKVVIVD